MPDCLSGGRGFETHRRRYRLVAQKEEQLSHKQHGAGSIPAKSTKWLGGRVEDYRTFNPGVWVRTPSSQQWRSSSKVERPAEDRKVVVQFHPSPQMVDLV